MISINKGVLSTLIKLVKEPILFISNDYLVLDINTAVEKKSSLKKKLILGKSLGEFYPHSDLETLISQTMIGQLMLHIGKEKFLCYVCVVDETTDNSPSIPSVRQSSKEQDTNAGNSFDMEQFFIDRLRHSKEDMPNFTREIYDYMENIIAEIPVSVYWMNKDYIYLGCSNKMAKLLNLKSRHDIIGKTYGDLYDKKSSSCYRKADKSVMEKGTSLSLEEPLYHPDGRREIYLSNKVPLYDSDGEIIGMLGISINITYRKKMEEDLLIAKNAAEAASRAKTEFIANMGHDIRTPLTGIIGLSHILEEEVTLPEEKEHAAMINSSGEQLLGLLNGVLDLITVDASTEDTVLRESFDLHQMIHDLLELERSAVAARQLSIASHIDESIPHFVVGDKMKLHRILLNLAGNAIKFTKVGRIEINAKMLSIQEDTVNIEFAVKDTGIGIPDELQEKVFDRFFKVSPSYKGLYTGNGIGLHIVQKYVDLMGGEIRLASVVGVGTTFSFVLPMTIGQKPEQEAESVMPTLSVAQKVIAPDLKAVEPVATQATQLNKPQVLLVEDNTAVMRVLMSMVQKYDVQVSSAVNAELAYQLVQSHPFDLIITDVGLSGKQGDELTAMIRAFEKDNQRQPTTIIGLTGHAVGEITQACLDAGMNMVYRKPIAPHALKALIEAIMPNDSETKESSLSDEALGVDLPKNEAELFELNQYPLLDLDLAVNLLGSEAMARDIFKSLKAEGIDADLALIKIAHEQGHWDEVEALAHKMKGGAVFGTVRLHYALLYMERYRKAGHSRCLEKLYNQMLNVIDETIAYLEEWLASS